jgi:TPP-dependent pyruvate/acetoin dehydrogenase alpha subunit
MMQKNGRVAICFFGEGALGQGLLYEEMNMAQVWKLPVIYVCENNLYNEYTHYSEVTAGDLLTRAKAFGMCAESVNGQDVRAVYQTAQELVERARKGEGPAFLVCDTYRYHGHHVGDINRAYYRSKQEEQEWREQRDPLKILSDWLVGKKMAEPKMLEQIQAEVNAEIEQGAQFALDAAYPDVSEVEEDVYA